MLLVVYHDHFSPYKLEGTSMSRFTKQPEKSVKSDTSTAKAQLMSTGYSSASS